MRELRSNKRKGAKVSISSVVTEMTQFSEEVFSPNSLDVDVVDTLWSDVHVAHYLFVIFYGDLELFFVCIKLNQASDGIK